MITISLKESWELYGECEDFSDGGMLSEDSPLRKKAEELFHQSYVSHIMMVCSMVYRTLAQSYSNRQRATPGDVLSRLKGTQCCDPVIDGLLGAAIEEITRLRSSVRNQTGDDLCWLKDADLGKIPPKHEFMQSCERFHAQVSGERGELVGCMTIAQLEAEIRRLQDELTQSRNTPTL